jgi:hypothetical protein
LAVTAAGAAHWRAQARRSPQRLRWDGQGWWLGERSVHPRVALDVGGWMLLRLHPAGAAGAAGAAGVAPGWPVAAAAWLPLSASRAGSAWPALRVALFATLDGAAAGTGEVPA